MELVFIVSINALSGSILIVCLIIMLLTIWLWILLRPVVQLLVCLLYSQDFVKNNDPIYVVVLNFSAGG